MSEPDAAPEFSIEQQRAIAIANGRARAAAAAGTKENPLDDTAHAAGAATIARASLAPDPQVQIKRYAEAFKQPVKDFAIIGDHIVRQIPGTDQYARVEPSVRGAKGPIDAAERAMDWVAQAAGPIIPAASSGVGVAIGGLAGIESGPGALATAALGGTIGGSAGEYARQKLDAALAPKGQEAPVDVGNVVEKGIEGGAGPIIGVGTSKVVGRLAPIIKEGLKDIGRVGAAETGVGAAAGDAAGAVGEAVAKSPTDFGLSPRVIDALKQHISGKEAELTQLREDAKAMGVDLSLGQLTGSEAVKQAERQLVRQPETVQAVADLRRAQNTEQIPGAVRSVMDEIAPEAPSGQQVGAFRDAGEAVVDQARTEQSKGAAAAFGKALDDRTDRYWNPRIDELMKRPSVQAGLGNARKIAAEEGFDRLTVPAYENGELVGRDTVPDWRSWQYIKKGIDSEIEAHTDAMTGKVDAYGRAAIKTKRELMGILTKENPEWGAALRQYGESADAIDQVLDGGVGFLNKMSGPDRQNIVNRVFSGQNLMADDVAAMRRQFMYAGKSAEWNAGVRSYIADALADAVAPLKGGGEPSNVGGALYRNLFEDRQSAILQAAMGGAENPATIGRWNQLGRVLKAASNQLPEGAPTATDTGAPGLIRRGIDAVSTHGASLGAELLDGLEKMKKPEEAKKLATYLLTPEGDKVLKSLAPTTPGTPKANSILRTMLIQAGIVTAVDRAVGDSAASDGNRSPALLASK
jgi:hypothetical protein